MKKYIILNTNDHIETHSGLSIYKIPSNGLIINANDVTKNNDSSKFLNAFREVPSWVTNEKIYSHSEITEELKKEEWN